MIRDLLFTLQNKNNVMSVINILGSNGVVGLIAVVILLNTQTRAAIFSFIPIVTICYFFYVDQD